ncbi:MAG: amidohydrolase [Bryobacterales bacterium]|nr:amidohydrolase [Bryobacterales bacterium]
MLIVDTHAHIYAADEKRYPTIEKPLRPPGNKGTLGQLREESAANGVAKACLIQTSTFYRFDNRYILDSSKVSSDWAAGVVTLDPENPESPNLLARYARDFGIRGMRSIPAAKAGKLDHPGVRGLWRTATDNGLVINVLVGRERTAEVDKLLGDFPRLRVVLDHCMNLKAGPDGEPILADVRRLARHKNLHAKLTFVPTGSETGYPCADMHQRCLDVIEAYGPERCVWGSDFPCELWTPKVSYKEHLRIFTHDLGLSQAKQQAILGETARRLWFA